jgi:hypothetical protein
MINMDIKYILNIKFHNLYYEIKSIDFYFYNYFYFIIIFL